MKTLLRIYFASSCILNWCLLSTFATEVPYFTVRLANAAKTVSDNEVFITIKGTNLDTEASCFVQFNAEGIGSLADVQPTTNPSLYSYSLSALPLFNATFPQTRTIELPLIESARIYFSIKYPLVLPITVNNLDVATINDPTPDNPQDPAYRLLYDKIEINYQTLTNNAQVSYQSFVNPTAVDFFCLPLGLFQTGDASIGALTHSGLTASRQAIVNQAISELSASPAGLDNSYNNVWRRLTLRYTDPSGIAATLRILSPTNSIVQNQAGPAFDDYFLTNGHPAGSEDYDFNYIDTVWAYYSNALGNNTITIDCSELGGTPPKFALSNYIFTGYVDSATENLVFTNADATYQVVVQKPIDSYPFFAGASFEVSCCTTAPCIVSPQAECCVNNTPGAIIVRQLSAAFIAGLLPAPSGTVVDSNYFKQQQSNNNYYSNNYCLNTPATSQCASTGTAPAQGPWYDLYSRVFSSFPNQPIYTSPFSDELNQSGAISVLLNSKLPPLVVTLGDLTGTNIPNPYIDPNILSVTVQIPVGSTVVYNDADLADNQLLTSISSPITVLFNLFYKANIYVTDGFVSPAFAGSSGIVVTGAAPATIAFPGCQASQSYVATVVIGPGSTVTVDGNPINNGAVLQNIHLVPDPFEGTLDTGEGAQDFSFYFEPGCALPPYGITVVKTGQNAVTITFPSPGGTPCVDFDKYVVTLAIGSGSQVAYNGNPVYNSTLTDVPSPMNVLFNNQPVTIYIQPGCTSPLYDIEVGSVSQKTLTITFPSGGTFNPCEDPNAYKVATIMGNGSTGAYFSPQLGNATIVITNSTLDYIFNPWSIHYNNNSLSIPFAYCESTSIPQGITVDDVQGQNATLVFAGSLTPTPTLTPTVTPPATITSTPTVTPTIFTYGATACAPDFVQTQPVLGSNGEITYDVSITYPSGHVGTLAGSTYTPKNLCSEPVSDQRAAMQALQNFLNQIH